MKTKAAHDEKISVGNNVRMAEVKQIKRKRAFGCEAIMKLKTIITEANSKDVFKAREESTTCAATVKTITTRKEIDTILRVFHNKSPGGREGSIRPITKSGTVLSRKEPDPL